MAYKINKQSWIQIKSSKEDGGYNLSGLGSNQAKQTRTQTEIAH